MKRLGDIPEYRRMFEAAYPGIHFDRMTFAHASNAIGGFLVDRFSFIESPWDRFLAGDDRAMTADQLAGAQTFLTIRCSLCHNGPALTDNLFHNVALARDTILNGVVLSATIIDQLTTFMGALTDPRARNLRSTVPQRVPSGLGIDRP